MTQPTMDDAQKWLKDHEEERSPARAVVYSDGQNAQIQYLWQDALPAPEGFTKAGTLYVVPAPPAKGWIAKARATDEKWQAVMAQAMPLFEAEVRQLIEKLNTSGGLSLADLPELLKLGNDSERLKELEETQKEGN
jgi:hypothetical protein